MDADLQHPPELIAASFWERWQEGNVMVYAQRTDRDDESAMRRGFARLFYRLFARFGEMPLPEGAGDFRLIDRKGVEVLRSLPERARFSKGLYSWIGFRSVGVPYQVEERQHGASKWSFRKLFRFAFDGITSFSTVPLRVWTYLGGTIAGIAFLTALYFVADTLLRGPDVPGYASLIVSVMFFSGVQLMSRHHRRVYRPHLRRGEAAPALRRRRADRPGGRGPRPSGPGRSPREPAGALFRRRLTRRTAPAKVA